MQTDVTQKKKIWQEVRQNYNSKSLQEKLAKKLARTRLKVLLLLTPRDTSHGRKNKKGKTVMQTDSILEILVPPPKNEAPFGAQLAAQL